MEKMKKKFLGRSVARQQNMSETAKKLTLKKNSLKRAMIEQEGLTEKLTIYKTKALLTYETLTGTEIEDIVNKALYHTCR